MSQLHHKWFNGFNEQFPPEVDDQVVCALGPNEVAGTVRVICKAASERFSRPEHKRIRLSQPVPHHAFAHHWGNEAPLRKLTAEKRQELLNLTAATGSIPNVRLLLRREGYAPTPDALTAAAASAQLPMCRWLLQQGCERGTGLCGTAGRSGSLEVCALLVPEGNREAQVSAMVGAARAGHTALLDQLLASYGTLDDAEELMPPPYPCSLGSPCAAPRRPAAPSRAPNMFPKPLPAVPQDDGSPYARAAARSDLFTLASLRRAACPWGAPGQAVCGAVRLPGGPAGWALEWLAAQGCPMDWALIAEACEEGHELDEDALDWLREGYAGWQRQQQQQGQQGQQV